MPELNSMPSVPTGSPPPDLVRVQDLDKPSVPQKAVTANPSTQTNGWGSLGATLPKTMPPLNKASGLAGTTSVQLISGPDFFTSTERVSVSGKLPGGFGWNAGAFSQQRDPVSPKGTFSWVLGASVGMEEMLFDDKTTSLKGALNFGVNRIFVDNNKPGGDLWQFSPGGSVTLNTKLDDELQLNTTANATFTASLVDGGKDWIRVSVGGESSLKFSPDKSKVSVSLGVNGQHDFYSDRPDQSAFGPFLRVSLNKDPITINLEGRWHAHDTITNPGVPFWGNGGTGDFSIGGSLNVKF